MKTEKTKSEPLWLQNFYLPGAGNRITEQLQRAGFQVTAIPDTSHHFSLVLVGESTPWDQVFTALNYCSRTGIKTICAGLFSKPPEHYRIWELLREGADDYLHWDEGAHPEEFIVSRLQRWKTVQNLMETDLVKKHLIGSCRVWKKTLWQVIESAFFSQFPVLLLGESGTGKELLAKLIHHLNPDASKHELVISDCTTIKSELSGSELFGHEKGAFTNALANRDGAFAQADGGTLFLDEIGELPLPIQAELLRAIQEKTYKRVGSNFWRKSNFRLVTATNRNLLEEVKQGRFRADLYFRISASVCHVPPLRDRADDIPDLVKCFLKKALNINQAPEVDETVFQLIRTRSFPGNVRELQQLVNRIASRYCGKGLITAGDIPETDRPNIENLQNPWQSNDFENALRIALSNGIGMKEIKRSATYKAMEIAIADEQGNLQSAAQKLQVSDRTLQMFYAASKNGTMSMDED